MIIGDSRKELLALSPPGDAYYDSSQAVEARVVTPSQNSKPTGSKVVVYGRDLNNSDLLLLGADRSLRKIMADEYGISEKFSWVYPEAFSTTSRKVIIYTGDGGKYFVKEKPRYCCTPYSLTLAAQFQEYLSSRTDFVPKIAHIRSGAPYLKVGEAIFFTTEFKNGRIFNASMQDIERAGVALGIIHNLSGEFSFEGARHIRAGDDSSEFINLAERLKGAENDEWRPVTILALKGLVEKYKDKLDGNVQYIVNHGDYAPFNLVYGEDGQVVAINDFDNVNFRPRTRDIAGALLSFCDGLSYAGATSSLRKPITTTVNLEKAKSFIECYLSTAYALSDQEKSDLVGEICVRWAKIMALGIVRGDFNYKDVLDAMSFADFVEENIPALV